MTDPERTREYRPPQRPSNNDVIKIDGRFAEVFSVSDSGMDFTYLDVPIEIGSVLWEGIRLIKVEDEFLSTSLERGNMPSGEGSRENVLGDRARFFGEYEKLEPN